MDFVGQLLKGKLKPKDFKTISPNKFDDSKKSAKRKVVVFIIGGVTYQENRELQLMAQKQGFEAIIGSTSIINSDRCGSLTQVPEAA